MSAEPTITDLVQDGRAALERHDWQDAFELLTRADEQGDLSGEDLEAVANAAWFTARGDAALDARERAFKAYTAKGDRARAGYLALGLMRAYLSKGMPSIASAWFRRAERLLEGEPESYAHGYLALARSDGARATNDIDAAVALATEAGAIAARTGDADLEATAFVSLGALRILTGATRDGFALLEEATVAAVNGELSPFTTGVTYCSMIAACRELTDYRRASEWTEATQRWCERQRVTGFPGVCRIHRAEIVALTGDWDRAEAELQRATKEMAGYQAGPPMADGFYALGEVRLRRGDLTGAEEALREAHTLGRIPQPALALLRLAEGKIEAAVAGIDGALEAEPWDRLAKARLLPAKVTIEIAAGDIAAARAAADELELVLEAYDAPLLQAGKHESWARVLLAEGDAAAAAREVRTAIRLWRGVSAPYDVARLRALLATALRAMGDVDGAIMESRAAREEFVRLGARLDAAALEQALTDDGRGAGPAASVRRAFMFTDIVGSTNLAETLGDEAWAHLLRWHDDALRSRVRESGGEIVNSTGDGFFVAFPSARPAIACAIAIQRALTEHRRSSGFAPSVRIGLHVAGASQRGQDYSGVGVNVAARVAAIAAGGEILATDEVLADAPGIGAGEPREAALRGVSTPVSVRSIPWT